MSRHRRLAADVGVRSVRRPVTPAAAEHFDLYYVRSGPVSACPLVIIPGGPGVASVAPYRRLRRRTAALGLDVIMVEHRGVGLSRRTDTGADLPPEALTVAAAVDDVAAVLDDAGVAGAVVYGISYGSYLAAGMGVRHPERVAAMILDSPLLCRDDITEVRAALRELLWDGGDPGTTALVPTVRRLTESGVLDPLGAQIAATLYGFGGPVLLGRQLGLLDSGRIRLWRLLNRIARLTTRNVAYRNEPDLVARIAFRELDYASEPDGLPLDPAVAVRSIGYPMSGGGDLDAEPYDLVAELPGFSWPTVVISGGRDLTTPPAVADRMAALVPGATLVRLPTMTHGALSTRQEAALRITAAVCGGDSTGLGARAAELDALPASPAARLATAALRTGMALEALLPGRRPATPSNVP